MFVNIDGTAVAIGIVCVIVALGLLFPSRAADSVELVRLTFASFLEAMLKAVEVSA